MKKLLLFICFLIFQANHAQTNFNCNHPEPTTENLKQISSLLKSSTKSGTKRIIPVVFHVLHQNGLENISDAQIFDQIEILNEDFQKLNADTIDIVSPFDTIFNAPNFEFRLATIDPNGNPTNGIDRIFTPLTNNQTPFITVNSWPSDKYVNIWVLRSMVEGVAGYNLNSPYYYTPNSCPSGIAMLHTYIGSVGTGSVSNSRALTHEMGHYFGLYHIWGDTNVISGIGCDYSDGIADTPQTLGTLFCDVNLNTCNDSLYPLSFAYWGQDVIDNSQNFMDYSYCSKMFTNMQADLMRSVGENPLYGRYNLHTDSNLIATGTGPGPIIAPINLPYVEFGSTNQFICLGDSIHFTNSCGNPASTTYLWSFPGGSPSSSTLLNPSVLYPTNGLYDVTLAVTNPNGTSTMTKSTFAQVVGNWADYTGPTQQVFDSLSPFWLVQNPEENSTKFELMSNQGVSNSACYKLTNQFVPDTTIACWNQTSGINNLLGNKDVLISPAYDLRTTTAVTVSFDYAYASASNPTSASEKLIVYSSRNCGQTWIQRAILTGTDLIATFAPQGSDFIPTSTQWTTKTFNYTANNLDDKTRFKFEFTASDSSNNLFIDNFIVTGVLNVGSNELNNIEIYPNPVTFNQFFNIKFEEELEIQKLEVLDAKGSIVKTLNVNNVIEKNGFLIDLEAGYYFLRIENQSGFRIEKVIVN